MHQPATQPILSPGDFTLSPPPVAPECENPALDLLDFLDNHLTSDDIARLAAQDRVYLNALLGHWERITQ